MGETGPLSKRTAAAGLPALAVLLLIAFLLNGCATLPPGSSFPKTPSVAFDHPEETPLGRTFLAMARDHGGDSGFHIVNRGGDGFVIRAQMIDAAERSIDLQYYIFRGDQTGRLLAEALLRAADRGVRVRILVDDADREDGDRKIAALQAHPNIEIRIFNPLAYRGSVTAFRYAEFVFNKSRLDYRMHNKLFVVDNAAALLGGRNVGNGFFQLDSDVQFGDDDMFSVGPVVKQLSATFDDYWNSTLAIPAQALEPTRQARLAAFRQEMAGPHKKLVINGVDCADLMASGLPLAAVRSGALPLVWAHAQVVCDSPYKADVESGKVPGRLMYRDVFKRMEEVRTELLMITPFLVPGADGMRLVRDLRERGVQVRILTNSLVSAPVPVAQTGYMRSRRALLRVGVELHEVRAELGSPKGSGEPRKMTRYTAYSLHAKIYVFDRESLYVGSMNFDQRSMHLNTEVGLIIDSPELARQAAKRFEAMADLKNSYTVLLQGESPGGRARLVWRTEEGGEVVNYAREPARSGWQRFKVDSMSLLPLDKEL